MAKVGLVHLPADLPAPSTERLRLIRDADLGLLTLADRLRQRWSAHAAAAGLSPAQVTALLTLRPGQAVPMRQLAAALDSDASNLSSLVDRLERRGAVERRPDPNDRRVKALVLTKEGERLRASFWRDVIEDPGPLAPLSKKELRTLVSLLDRLGADAAAAKKLAGSGSFPSARSPRVNVCIALANNEPFRQKARGCLHNRSAGIGTAPRGTRDRSESKNSYPRVSLR